MRNETKTCNACGAANHETAVSCHHCHEALPVEPASTPLSAFEAEQQSERERRTARRVVWTIALLIIGYVAMSASSDFGRAESAPQQAAAAGINIFYIIIPYMIARGIDAMLR